MNEHGCCADKKFGGKLACNDDTCMQLPEGVTCDDCVSFKRCSAMFGAFPGRDYCDFFPRRFFPKRLPSRLK